MQFFFSSLTEAFRPPNFRDVGTDKYGFHIGKFNNFKEVFGENCKTWFLPVSTRYFFGIYLMM